MAIPSRKLTSLDASIARALKALGWAQHDVASLLGCNPGRIAEISTGARFPGVPAADLTDTSIKAKMAEIQNLWNLRINRQLATALR